MQQDPTYIDRVMLNQMNHKKLNYVPARTEHAVGATRSVTPKRIPGLLGNYLAFQKIGTSKVFINKVL